MSDVSQREYRMAQEAGKAARRGGKRITDCPYRGSTTRLKVLAEAWCQAFKDQDDALKGGRPMRFDHYFAVAAVLAEQEIVNYARQNMSAAAFKEWQDERTAERRHRELCRSIERAGENARPRGLGIFL